MRITDQYLWNVIFGIFFLSLLSMGMIILSSEGYLNRENLTLADVAIMTLASFRLTRLFVYDSITKFFREQFCDVETKRGGKAQLVRPAYGPRRTLNDLLSCPWCFGLWAASTIAFFYMLTPMAYFPTLVLAIAGVATLLQITANLIGHKAEKAKIEVGG
jgi:hypothetical protein